MDFGSVLHKAQSNQQNSKQGINFYKTTFAPPKKEQREKKLSVNIQKFLARKEAEEKRKKLEAERKKQELLALRNQDKKSFKRVQSMLKRTKSANKSVIEDAIDNINTAVTVCGPLQPDEDDYGYVSKDASDLYNKLINKYSSMPPEEPKFSKSPVKSTKDILSTKDRVKAALQREEEEKFLPRKRRRKNKNEGGEENVKNSDSDEEESSKKEMSDTRMNEKPSKQEKFKIPKRHSQQPPLMDFQALLKLAEQKQYEPIVIERPVEDKPDRPMTEKEKQEYLREQARKLRRENLDNYALNTSRKSDVKERNEMKGKNSKYLHEDKSKVTLSSSNITSSTGVSKSENQVKKIQQRIPEGTEKELISSKNYSVQNFTASNNFKKLKSADVSRESKLSTPVTNKPKSIRLDSFEKNHADKSETSSLVNNSKSHGSVKQNSNATSSVQSGCNYSSLREQMQKSHIAKMSSNLSNKSLSKLTNANIKPSKLPQNSQVNKIVESKKSDLFRQSLSDHLIPPNKVEVLKKQSMFPKTNSVKQFPPPDVKRNSQQLIRRRKVIESDEEYDSEMDDFIDDSEDTNDVSKYISEIFGYDRSKYSQIDEDNNDECMESNFSQLQKEEFISTKYGILEDLADVRRTKMEKERKKKRLMFKS